MPSLVPVDYNPFDDGSQSTPSTWKPPQPDPISGQVPADPVGTVLSNLPGYLAGKAQQVGGGILDAAMAPADVMEGRASMNDPATQDRLIGLAGLISNPAMAEGDPATLNAGITAYHGSPHNFDAFDLSKIGTGEGAQAYGHGLYFAGNEGVAKSYRDALSPASSEWYQAQDHVQRVASDLRDAQLEYFRSGSPEDLNAVNKLQEKHDAAVSTAQGLNQSAGHMYQVQINADPEHFLDWDKPLSEQHPVVQEALQKGGALDAMHAAIRDGATSLTDPAQATGEDIYHALREKAYQGAGGGFIPGQGFTTADEAASASQALRDAGVPGIKYRDAGSRGMDGARQASHNYVSFSDKNIDILKKYGLAGLGLGGAAMAGALGQGLGQVGLTPVDHDPFVPQT